jgi:outer membrane receptor protein involved in Fe transport
VNVRYLGGANAGHAWVAGGRSFKAPTPDQLFDQRRIPVPFPPFAISTSNAELVPQYGTTIEGGVYQTLALAPALTVDLTVSAYRMRMKDELDFDIATLRYVNIGRSRHRGIETGLRVNNARGAAAWLNLTWHSVTAEAGEHAGNRIRAVPGTLLSGGASIAPLRDLEAGILITHSRDTWLDSGNTVELAPFTRTDARLAYRIAGAGVQLFVDVRNLLDLSYNSTGFPDPSGSGTIYYFPAAGRAIEVGVRR